MFERIMGLNVIDETAYEKYREGMRPILNSYGADFGYDFIVSEVLITKTTEKINRVFTIDFPSEKVMEAFFVDPDYIAVRVLILGIEIKLGMLRLKHSFLIKFLERALKSLNT